MKFLINSGVIYRDYRENNMNHDKTLLHFRKDNSELIGVSQNADDKHCGPKVKMGMEPESQFYPGSGW